MRIRDYGVFLLDGIFRRKLLFILNIILCFIAFVLIGGALQNFNLLAYRVEKVRTVTAIEEDRLCVMKSTAYNFLEDETYGKRLNQILAEVKGLSGVAWAGRYTAGTLVIPEYLDDPKAIEIARAAAAQDETRIPSEVKIRGMFGGIAMDRELLGACRLGVLQEQYERFVVDEEGRLPILAGAAYRDLLKEGQVLVNAGGKQYVVIGFLKEGCRFFYEGGILESTKGYTPLDNRIIILPEDTDNSLYVSSYKDTMLAALAPGADVQEVTRQVNEAANRYGMGVEFQTLSQEIQAYRQSQAEEIRRWGLLALTVIGLGLLSVTATGAVGVLMEKRQYAIYMASGISTRSIGILVALENGVKVLLGMLLAAGYIYRELQRNWIYSEGAKAILKEVLMGNTFPVLVALALLAGLATSVIPIGILRRCRVSALLRQEH